MGEPECEDAQAPLRPDVRGPEAAAHLVTSSGPYREPRAEPGPERRTPGALLSPSRVQTEAGCPCSMRARKPKAIPGSSRLLLIEDLKRQALDASTLPLCLLFLPDALHVFPISYLTWSPTFSLCNPGSSLGNPQAAWCFQPACLPLWNHLPP